MDSASPTAAFRRASAYEGDVYSLTSGRPGTIWPWIQGHIAPVTPYYNNLKDAIVQATQGYHYQPELR